MLEAVKAGEGNEVLIMTRKSDGYDDFHAYIDLTDIEVFMEILQDLEQFDLSQNSIMKKPILTQIGDNQWFVLRVEKSKRGNWYRSVRIETHIGGKNAINRFHIHFPSLTHLLPAIQKIIREKN